MSAAYDPPVTRRLQVLIVDNEAPACDRLARMLAQIGSVDVVAQAASGIAALEEARRYHVDGVFLDIQRPGKDGLSVARELDGFDPAPAVVFTTAYEHHALEAFEARALDYLLKPVRQRRLESTLERIAALREPGVQGGARTHFSALVGTTWRSIPVAQVRFLRADRRYVEVGHPGGDLILEESLANLEAEFPVEFIRIHRNALVAVRFVKALERDGSGYVVLLEGMPALEVSRRMVPGVKARLFA
jgi:two-component system response regulator AlgR